METKGFFLCSTIFCLLLIHLCPCQTNKRKKNKTTCGVNEIWDPCPSVCHSDIICDIANKTIKSVKCQLPPKKPCKGKCKCKEGYARLASDNSCVVKDICCPGPNEELVSCPNPCPGGTCEMPSFAACPLTPPNMGCQCKDGYVRNSENKCILLDDCKYKCGPNEIWHTYKEPCFIEYSCEMILSNIQLMPCLPPPETAPLMGRCKCAPGYYRINGKCVPLNECCPKANMEVVSCPNPCPGGTCLSPKYENCSLPCNPMGCQCKEGYLKNNNDDCISLAECRGECGLNEVWNPCPKRCAFDETCQTLIQGLVGMRPFCRPVPPAVEMNWPCKGACQCMQDHVRIDGKCQPISMCCTEPNTELVQCANICPGGTCMTPRKLPCPKPCAPWACQCKSGYVLNMEQKCVPLSECNEKCGVNEVWNDCETWCTLDDDTCETYGQFIDMICSREPETWQCPGKCRCINGYIKVDGKCDDPQKCCTNIDPNSRMADCANACPQTCDAPNVTSCDPPCFGKGCECKEGFILLNERDLKCVHHSECPIQNS